MAHHVADNVFATPQGLLLMECTTVQTISAQTLYAVGIPGQHLSMQTSTHNLVISLLYFGCQAQGVVESASLSLTEAMIAATVP
jgi:hypothetical protein